MHFWCCGGERERAKRDGSRRRQKPSKKQSRKTLSLHKSSPSSATDKGNRFPSESHIADEDWLECRTEFSVDGGASPRLNLSPAHSRGHSPQNSFQVDSGPVVRPSDMQEYHEALDEGVSETSDDQDNTIKDRIQGCFHILADKIPHPGFMDNKSHLNLEGVRPSARSLTIRPPIGSSLQQRDVNLPDSEVTESWEACADSVFRVRGVEYMRTKQKVASATPFYQLLGADCFSFDQKFFHVAKSVTLPEVPPSNDPVIPPLLIVNLQLPMYPAGFFGPADGPGHSICFYYKLREDFDAIRHENEAAVGLMRRWFQNGREADGTPTRERLKLIARVVNVEEWAENAPLSGTEHKLLTTYNEKPVLTRPQQAFFTGPNYFEVDLDIHTYSFLARRALSSFLPRIKGVVWEVALVLQGNDVEELPERLLTTARLYRLDFTRARPLIVYTPRASGASASNLGDAAKLAAAPAEDAVTANGHAAVGVIPSNGHAADGDMPSNGHAITHIASMAGAGAVDKKGS